MDKLVAVFNCIALANPINNNNNNSNNNITSSANTNVNVPMALVSGIYPELYTIWNGNYN